MILYKKKKKTSFERDIYFRNKLILIVILNITKGVNAILQLYLIKNKLYLCIIDILYNTCFFLLNSEKYKTKQTLP